MSLLQPVTDRGSIPCPLALRARSFTGIFFRRGRLLVLLLVMIAIDAVLSSTSRDEPVDEVQEARVNDGEILMCRIVRIRRQPLQLENRVDWCPLR